MTRLSHRNWNHTCVTHPARIVAPTSDAEVLAILQDPVGHPAPVRAAGHGHSLTPCIAADDGTLVRTEGLAGIRSLDPARRTVTVGAGTSLLAIAEALLPDWQLPVMPEIGNATAGSVACCGTKDSSLGPGPGQVSSAVVGLTIVTPGGTEEVTEAADPERLALLRCSYGLLGLITEVTFRIEPVQVLEFDYQSLDMNPLPSLAAVLGGAAGFLGFLQPHERTLIVERRTVAPVDARVTPLDRLQIAFRSALWESGGSAIGAHLAGDRRSRLPAGNRLTRLKTALGASLVDHLIEGSLDPLHFRARRADTTIDFASDRPDYFEFTFWAFPVSAWPTVVPAYLTFCESFRARQGFRAALPTEIYHIARDTRSPLSVSHDENVFTLDMVHAGTAAAGFGPRWVAMNQEFNRFAATHGGRPLLNQTKELDRPTLDTVRQRQPWFDQGCRRLAAGAIPRLVSPFFRELLL